MDSYEKLYNSVCRLCLKFKKNDIMIPLFDEMTGKLNCYGKAVTTFSNIKLTENVCLPSSMCKMCLVLLKKCIYFKFLSETSEKQLLRISHLSSEESFKQRVVEYTMCKDNNVFDLNSEIDAKYTSENNLLNDNLSKVRKTEMSSKFSLGVKTESSDPPNSVKRMENDLNNSKNKILDTLKTSVSSDVDLDSEYITMKPRRRFKRILRRRILKHVLREKQNSKRQKYACKVCNKVLANQNTYDNHMQRHNGCRYICEHCGKGFPVLAELQMHLVARHGTGPYLQCPHCPFKAPRKFDLIEHERIHSGERPFTCEKCGLTFRRRGIWKKHLIYHAEKTIQCTLCPKKFFQRSQMLSHYNSVHERMYMYVCGKCGALYAKPITVRRHLIDRHGIPREMQGKILRVKKSSGFQE